MRIRYLFRVINEFHTLKISIFIDILSIYNKKVKTKKKGGFLWDE
jgi:hypothetical protein